MANLSDLTRKEQVLQRLQQANGGWVDGPDLANEECGGSEGLRRLRELVEEDGYNVRKRRHPDAERDIWQYRLVPPPLHIEIEEPETPAGFLAQSIEQALEPAEPPVYPKGRDWIPAEEPQAPPPARESAWPADHNQTRISDAVRRKEDGTFEYVPPQRPIEQLTTPEPPTEPDPVGEAFTEMPRHISFGEVAICPRCRQRTSRGRPKKRELTPEQEARKAIMARRKKMNEEIVDLVDPTGYALFRDPYSRKPIPCQRCNGYGIVPNVGPIPLAPVTGMEKPAPLDFGDEAETTEAFPE